MSRSAEDALMRRLRAHHELPAPAERRRIREQAGCSLRALAAAIGVSWMAIDRWEKGSQPRNPEHVAAYRRLLEAMRELGG